MLLLNETHSDPAERYVKDIKMTQAATDIIPLERAASIAELFQERVRRSPDTPAYTQHDASRSEWVTLTWLEAAQQVARWRTALAAEGLEQGDRIALMLGNRPEWAFFDQAAQSLGLVTVPLYTNDRGENVGYILNDAEVRLLLVGDKEQWSILASIREQLADLDRILILDDSGIAELPKNAVLISNWLPTDAKIHPPVKLDPDCLATIVYTSGTTGRPKGVMLSHRNILWNVFAGLQTVSVYPGDRFLSFLPLSHMLERTGGYYLPMAAGAEVAYARSIAQLGEDLLRLQPTIMISVPRIFERVYGKIQAKLADDSSLARTLFNQAVDIGWRRFLHQQQRGPWSIDFLLWPLLDRLVATKVRAKLGGRLRLAVSGGAALSPDITRLFVGLGITISQGYGLTETSPVISVNPLADNDPASVGVPLGEVEVRVGGNDELLTRSPSVMLGYWKNEEATRSIIDQDGWLHTGDKVKIENNHIFITGRLKEIIVLATGEKVPPVDMEMAILLDGLIEQSMIIGEGRPYLAALIVPNSEQLTELLRTFAIDAGSTDNLNDSRLQDFIIARISKQLSGFPGYAQVRRVAIIPELWTVEDGLITPTLKLKRNRILERYQEEVKRLYSGHASYTNPV